jgi:hypothetical protein
MSYTIQPEAAAVLESLYQLAKNNNGVIIINKNNYPDDSGIMPVSVEILYEENAGAVISVAHYFESCGDLVPDPDMTFVRSVAGGPDCLPVYTPLEFQDQYKYQIAAEVSGGKLVVINPRLLRELSTFVSEWMKNITWQQDVEPFNPTSVNSIPTQR